MTITHRSFVRVACALILAASLSIKSTAQTKLLGEGTNVTPLGSQKIRIEIVVLPPSQDPTLESMQIKRTGTITIWHEHKRILSQTLYITQPGDTKAWSLIAFYVDKGYAATLRVDMWQPSKPFHIHDTFMRTATLSGSITALTF